MKGVIRSSELSNRKAAEAHHLPLIPLTLALSPHEWGERRITYGASPGS